MSKSCFFGFEGGGSFFDGVCADCGSCSMTVYIHAREIIEEILVGRCAY